MRRRLFVAGAIAALLAVAAGAFGAHALPPDLEPRLRAAFVTATQYQMYHALALLVLGALERQRCPSPWIERGGWCFVAGMILFSGSLYALALSGVRALGMITPVGGALFLAGWLCVIRGSLRHGD